MALAALLAVCAASGCSRGFSDPATSTAPPHLRLTSAVGEDNDGGRVIQPESGAPVVRGGLHLVVEQDRGAPLSRVDFWTPGLPHEAVDGGVLSWDVETGDVVPLGGVMLVYVTPYDSKGAAAEPLQLSFVVDNQPPELTEISPAPGTPLTPGAFELRFCVRDRPSVTGLTVSLDEGVVPAEDPAAGPHCYVAALEAQPNGLDELDLRVKASDDVGNSASTAVTYPVHRGSPIKSLHGAPATNVDRYGGPVRVGSGYALVVASAIGDGEGWLTPSAASIRIPQPDPTAIIPVGGPGGLFVEVNHTDPPPSIQLVSDGGEAVDGGFLPDSGAFDSVVHVASGQALSCIAPGSYAVGDPVVCWRSDGAAVSAPMPAPDGSLTGTSDWLGFIGGQLLVEYGADGAGYQSHLAVYGTGAGLDRLEDPAGFPLNAPGSYQVDPFGMIISDATSQSAGWLLDAQSNAARSFSKPRPNALDLGVTPGGAILYEYADPARSQLTFESTGADGGALVLGCAPPDIAQADIRFAFDSSGHLYLAWPTPQGTAQVRAFAAGGAFSWEWSGTAGVPVTQVQLALDPAQSASSRDATLLVLMPEQEQYTILSRLDPLQPLPSPCH